VKYEDFPQRRKPKTMGLTYARTKDRPIKLLALTGLTRAEFTDLLVAFNKVSQSSRLQLQQTGGRKVALHSNGDRLLFILVYLKTYPWPEITGELFGMEMAQVNECAQRLLPVVCDALDELGAMPEGDGGVVMPARGKQCMGGMERRRLQARRPGK
jgi:hypothetical protein